jgi:hypothetical protein
VTIGAPPSRSADGTEDRDRVLTERNLATAAGSAGAELHTVRKDLILPRKATGVKNPMEVGISTMTTSPTTQASLTVSTEATGGMLKTTVMTTPPKTIGTAITTGNGSGTTMTAIAVTMITTAAKARTRGCLTMTTATGIGDY